MDNNGSDKQIEVKITHKRGGAISVNSPVRRKNASQLVSMQIKMSAVITIECFITLGSFKIAFRDMSICMVGLIESLLCKKGKAAKATLFSIVCFVREFD